MQRECQSSNSSKFEITTILSSHSSSSNSINSSSSICLCHILRATFCHFRIAAMPLTRSQLTALTVQLLLRLLLLLPVAPPVCQAVGYSYTRFSGPVSGPEQKIYVRDALHGDARVDFIAKPAYEFAYGVEDGAARLLQNRHETRDGDAVQGSYSVVDPDGNLRVVKYTADHINGFQAEVITNGLAAAIHGHGHNQHIPPQAQPQQLQYYPGSTGAWQHTQSTHPPAGALSAGIANGGGGVEGVAGNYAVSEQYDDVDKGAGAPRKPHKTTHHDDGDDGAADGSAEYEDEHEAAAEDEEDERGDYNERSAEAHSNEADSDEYY